MASHKRLSINLVASAAALMLTGAAQAMPVRVSFPGPEGVTLTGYVFAPSGGGGQHPAVVMMHGRGGVYSSRAKGRYDAATLSRRHMFWGTHWARQGYVAILVDGFGPRGHPDGFPRFSYKDRPAELNEVTVRPRDAQAAIVYLRTRADVSADRIALQGWSNGGSAVLAAMAQGANEVKGFRGALAFYPACGLKGQYDDGIVPYAPVRMFIGSADEEVSAIRCNTFDTKSRSRGGDIALKIYAGATHGFDDPSAKRAQIPANAAAAKDALAQATAFFASIFNK